jgi:hypothetical protein
MVKREPCVTDLIANTGDNSMEAFDPSGSVGSTKGTKEDDNKS